MRTIGIFTRDFSVFHDLVRLLKERDVEFFSLKPGVPPPWITVVITTADCIEEIEFDHLVIAEKGEVKRAVDRAVLTMGRDRQYLTLIIGIDPGEKPGVAVYGDRTVLMTEKVEFPEDIAALVKRIIGLYDHGNVLVRIGHGAPTYRNRIINVLLPLGVNVEIVDERSTTIKHRTPDIQAAIRIALKEGKIVTDEMIVAPSQGEIDDIKRRSRIKSGGKFTINSEQAEAVIRGETTLEKVIEKMDEELFGKRKRPWKTGQDHPE
jgi:hypothetical protein